MILGSLIDAGLGLKTLKEGLKKLPLKGYEIKTCKVKRGELSGTQFVVKTSQSHHKIRNLKHIISLLDRSALSADIKESAKKIFENLARVEGRIHNIRFNKVHFHELGSVDSIIDIVGFCIAIEALGIEKIYTSCLPLGRGVAKTEHGTIPIPAPAALGLLQGSGIRSILSPDSHELVTPTGAGILATFARDGSFGMPSMRLLKVGYGAGSRDNKGGMPNLLRVIIGETASSSAHQFQTDEVEVLEANIDDLNPVGYEYVVEKLLKEGALDVFFTPIQMKKTRPGILLTILCEPEDTAKFASVIFDETSTFGIRHYRAGRFKLDRRIKQVKTKFGKIRVKAGFIKDSVKSISPEYEDCKRIAETRGIPFRVVYDEAKRAVNS